MGKEIKVEISENVQMTEPSKKQDKPPSLKDIVGGLWKRNDSSKE